jgi:hypothetical protein
MVVRCLLAMVLSAEALQIDGLIAPAVDLRHDVVDVRRGTLAGLAVLNPLAPRMTEKLLRPTPSPFGAIPALRRRPAAACATWRAQR